MLHDYHCHHPYSGHGECCTTNPDSMEDRFRKRLAAAAVEPADVDPADVGPDSDYVAVAAGADDNDGDTEVKPRPRKVAVGVHAHTHNSSC